MCNSAKQPAIYYIDFTTTADNTQLRLYYYQTVAGSVKMTAGNGAEFIPTDVNTRSSYRPTYATAGNYTITIEVLTDVTDFNLAAADNNGFFPYGSKRVTRVYIPDGVTVIGANTMRGDILASNGELRLPDSIKTIGTSAFEQTKYGYGSPSLPAELETIGNRAFYNCSSLTTVTIPPKVSAIEEAAFRFSPLTSVTFQDRTPPTIGANAFGNISGSATVYIPSGTLAAYQTAFSGSGLENKTIIEQ